MEFNVADETSSLRSVIIGVARNSGKIPDLKDLYDPKSVRNLKNNSYPSESDLKKELSEFITILKNIMLLFTDQKTFLILIKYLFVT